MNLILSAATGYDLDGLKPFLLTSNEEGIIATVGYDTLSTLEVDAVGRMVRLHGRAPAILHQYDRHDRLVDLVAEWERDAGPDTNSHVSSPS